MKNKIKLSIVIPQYKEDDKTVRRLLSSIDYQLGINFKELEVIVVNDGSDVLLSNKMLKSFDNIKPFYLKLPQNVGCGLCRQAGLDIAKGDYVAFCDADDVYQNFGVFSLFFSDGIANNIDIYNTSWLEELKTENGMHYVEHGLNATWLHGKMFKKSFLTDNNITFSDKLVYHEDSYILSNMFALTENIKHVPVVSYVWSWGDNSITRNNNANYTFSSFPEYIRAIRYSCEWLKEHNHNKLPEKVFNLIIYVYTFLQENLSICPIEYMPLIEKELRDAILTFKTEVESVSNEEIFKMYKERLNTLSKGFLETETLAQFIYRITQ